MMRNLNQLAAEVHASNEKWWTDLDTGKRIERNKGELLMLIVSEIAEAMEGERKGLMDDKLPHRAQAEVEIADVVIRALDFAGGFELLLCNVNRHSLPDNRGEALLVMTLAVIEAYRAHSTTSAGYLISVLIACAETYCRKFGYDLWGAYEEKMEFNKTRVDHTLEARRSAGGKKW